MAYLGAAERQPARSGRRIFSGGRRISRPPQWFSLFSWSSVWIGLHKLTATIRRLGIERLDHCAFFVALAGTCTRVTGILFRGWLRWGPLVLIWVLAIVGITLKAVFFDDLAEWLGLTLYLVMGWLGIFGGVLLARRH